MASEPVGFSFMPTAVVYHEIYLSLVDVGFTEEQAFRLLIEFVPYIEAVSKELGSE